MIRFFAAFLLLAPQLHAKPTTPQEIAVEIIAPLLDPAKVASLKSDRAANPRAYKIHHWLEIGHRAGGDVSAMLEAAQAEVGYKDSPGGRADRSALLWSRRKLEAFGCFTEDGMDKLRRGGSPEITEGEHKGDSVELDHVIPRAIVPELDARFYNLEILPSEVNGAKSATITEREVLLARRWNKEGLLSAEGLQAVEMAAE
ncbi:MAG: hypothetical protein ACSHX9_02185 [Luteolibacter sp.]